MAYVVPIQKYVDEMFQSGLNNNGGGHISGVG